MSDKSKKHYSKCIDRGEKNYQLTDHEKEVLEGTKSIISVLERLSYMYRAPVLISAMGTILHDISDINTRKKEAKKLLEGILFAIEDITK